MYLYRVEIEWPLGDGEWDSVEFKIVERSWAMACYTAEELFRKNWADRAGDVVCLERMEKVDAVVTAAKVVS